MFKSVAKIWNTGEESSDSVGCIASLLPQV